MLPQRLTQGGAGHIALYSPLVGGGTSPSPFDTNRNGKLRSRLLLISAPAIISLLFWTLGSRHFPAVQETAVGLQPGAATFRYATPVPALTPYEVHPIRTLMRDAKKHWEGKSARQSTTLEEAVREYRRRNGREPPPGFDAWYAFATLHDTQLIDEFDQILLDVTPLFALPPAELANRVKVLESTSDSHAFVHISSGSANWTGPQWRGILPDAFLSETADFLHLLPDMEVPLGLHDGPSIWFDAEAKRGYLDAAAEGRYVNETELTTAGWTPWRERERTCLPNTPFRRAEMGLENEAPQAGPSFIDNHLKSMDYCQNPSSLFLHGSDYQTRGLARVTPTFTLSKTSINADLLWPAPIQYHLIPDNEIPFSAKPHHRVVWRGSLDGVWVNDEKSWRHTHRFRAVFLTNSKDTTQTRKVRMTKRGLFGWGPEQQLDVDETLNDLNERYSAVRPTNMAVQCDQGLCDHINTVFDNSQNKISLEEMADHRYVLDVDGNSYSARFRTHLASNQVPLKSTRYPEFYRGRIQPWVHYVPLKEDYSDLYNILAFYSGDLSPERVGNHDAMAEEIALAGKEWAAKFWRPIDTKIYIYRLLLEYGRVMDPHRTAAGPSKEAWQG